ncbi:MAG: FemAB family XrtA/PEP-CTERM system-associated protein [Candidatus Zixiibacteriota bacterium]
MVRVVAYAHELENSWAEYVQNTESSNIAHRLEWRYVISESLGHRPRYLVALDDSKVVGILPLFVVTTWWRAKYIVSVPWLDYGGIVADSDDVEILLLDEARRITEEEGAKFLELRSVSAGSVKMEERLDKASFILKLTDNSEDLWKSFNAKLRNQIRKAQKSQLYTEIGGVELLDSFYDVFSRNMRDLGTPVWGKDLFRRILSAFPQSAEIIQVKKDEDVVAGGLILSFKKSQYVPSASSLRSFINLCPNHALYWSVIARACESRFDYFDFGRSSWDSGTFNFKKQWGAEPTQLVWQYHLNKATEVPRISPDNRKYRTVIGLWKKLPLGLANYLGPKLIRNFP